MLLNWGPAIVTASGAVGGREGHLREAKMVSLQRRLAVLDQPTNHGRFGASITFWLAPNGWLLAALSSFPLNGMACNAATTEGTRSKFDFAQHGATLWFDLVV